VIRDQKPSILGAFNRQQIVNVFFVIVNRKLAHSGIDRGAEINMIEAKSAWTNSQNASDIDSSPLAGKRERGPKIRVREILRVQQE
jgi:hypothetical protein